jgi:predicted Na+-dependent transporter
MATNNYSTKDIIKNFIQKDIEEIKKTVKKIEKAVSAQLITITMLVNWKKNIERKQWFKKDWIKAIILVFLTAFLTSLFMTIGSCF